MRSRFHRDFRDDVGGRLIDAKAEIGGLAQIAVARPLGETHLDDELRRAPVRGRICIDGVDERRRLALDFLEPRVKFGEFFYRKSRSDRADVTQPFFFVNAEQQRAEAFAAALGFGPAADDELLLELVLILTQSRLRRS